MAEKKAATIVRVSQEYADAVLVRMERLGEADRAARRRKRTLRALPKRWRKRVKRLLRDAEAGLQPMPPLPGR